MSTTSKEEATWKTWGQKGTKAPKIKEYAELLIKHNEAAIAVYKENIEKLIQKKNEEQKHG